MSWIWRQQVSQCLLLLLLSVSFGLEADEIANQEHDEQRSPASNYLRIVGGQDVVDSTNSDGTRYGFFVSLVDQDYRHQCGGTLVAPDMVLTSSHCSRYVRLRIDERFNRITKMVWLVNLTKVGSTVLIFPMQW